MEHTLDVIYDPHDDLLDAFCITCGFRAFFAPQAAENDEVCCLHCEGLLPPEDWEPCEPDQIELPPIEGASHGDAHHYTEWRSCKVPLRVITIFGHRLAVHDGLVDVLAEIDREWRALGGHSFYNVHTIYCYACRNTRSGTSTSAHAYAIALDVNPQQNPYTKNRRADGSCPRNIPQRFADLFLRRGFGWGANWRSVCDSMHFSKKPNEGGNGLLYEPKYKQRREEEDEMTPKEWERMEGLIDSVVGRKLQQALGHPTGWVQGAGETTLPHGLSILHEGLGLWRKTDKNVAKITAASGADPEELAKAFRRELARALAE